MKKRYWLLTLTAGSVILLLMWGIAITKACVTGNPDFEKNTGFCLGNSRKDEKQRLIKEAERKKEEKAALQAERLAKESALEAKRKEEREGLARGMIYTCESLLKEHLRDPDSYQRIDASAGRARTNPNTIYTIIKYRSKNGFGGYGDAAAGCEGDATTKMVHLVKNLDI